MIPVDQLSELEELMDAACREWIAKGRRLGRFTGRDARCGCLLEAVSEFLTGSRQNWAWVPQQFVAGTCYPATALVRGFEGSPPHGHWSEMSLELYRMAERFRQRSLAGEYRA